MLRYFGEYANFLESGGFSRIPGLLPNQHTGVGARCFSYHTLIHLSSLFFGEYEPV